MSEISANPYVGLRPYEMDESMLFFGRDDQTLELLQHLHHHHFVAIVGSSGCGKSSLLRAGLIPSLKAGYLVEDSDRWIIAIMKPGQSPLYNLSEALLQQIDPSTSSDDISSLLQKINEEGSDAILECLETFRKKQNINFFLLVDQFEELFRFSMDQKNAAKKDEAIDFVNILLQLTQQRNIPFYVVLTMRSDFIGDCDQFFGLPEAMNKSQYLVPRLNRIQMKTVIEGPVKLRGNKINSALTSRLLNELGKVKDELPLLQHALMRMWDFELTVNNSGELDLEDYKNIGGIENALSKHADEVLYGKPEEGKPGMNEEDMLITKKLFQALTEIDENGRKIRYPVKLSQLKELTGAGEEKLLSIIDLFIKDGRSFLIINKAGDTGDKIIDISHESLIRQWTTLSKWVDEEGESASIYLQLAEDNKRFTKNKKYLEGLDLQTTIKWREDKKPTEVWAQKYKENFKECMQYLADSEKAWKDAEKRKKNNRRNKLISIGSVTILVIAFLAYFLTQANIEKNKNKRLFTENNRLISNNYWNNSKNKTAEIDYVYALANAAEAINIDTSLSKKILADIEHHWPQVILNNVIADQSQIVAAAYLEKDSSVIVTASSDFVLRKWNASTGEKIGQDIPLKVKPGKTKSKNPSKIIGFTQDGNKIITTDTSSFLHVSLVKNGLEDPVFSKIPMEEQIYFTNQSDALPVFNREGNKLISAYSSFDQYYTPLLNFSIYNFDKTFTKREIKFKPKINSDQFYYQPKISNLTFNNDATKFIFVLDKKKIYIGNTVKGIITEVPLELPPTSTFTEQGTNKPNKNNFYEADLNHTSFTAEENILLTVAKDSTIRLWDLKTGQEKLKLKHRNPVLFAYLIPKSNKVFTRDEEGSTFLWDKTQFNHPIGHSVKLEPSTHKVGFRSDGKQILVVENNVVFLWDLFQNNFTNSEENSAFNPGNLNYRNPIYSPDSKKIIVTSSENNSLIFQILDPQTGNKICPDLKPGIKSDIPDLINKILYSPAARIFSPDSKKVLTQVNDTTLLLWDAETGKQIGNIIPFINSQKPYFNLPVFSKDSKKFLVSNKDTTLKLINSESGKQIGKNFPYNPQKDIPLHANPVLYYIVLSPDSTKLLTHNFYISTESSANAYDENKLTSTIQFWNIETGQQIGKEIKYQKKMDENMMFDIDLERWFSQSGLNNDLSLPLPFFSQDGKKIYTFFKNDGVFQIWDAENGKQVGETVLFKSQWLPFLTADRKFIISAVSEDEIQFLNAETGNKMADSIKIKHASSENAPILNKDGTRIIVFQKNDTIQLVNVKTGKEVKEKADFKHQNYSVSPVFSPDGKLFLTCDLSGFMRLWDSETGKQKGPAMKYQKSLITEMNFSPDSKKIFTITFSENLDPYNYNYNQNTAIFWDAETAKQIGDGISIYPDWKLKFSDDGKSIWFRDNYGGQRWSLLKNIETGDLDISTELLDLQVKMVSGYRFDFETNEKISLSPDDFRKIKKSYDSLAKLHYPSCQYQNYNFWRRFHDDLGKNNLNEKKRDEDVISTSQFEILSELQRGDKTKQENNGDYLEPNQAIYSKNKKYILAYQKDGDLVIYRVDNMTPIWSSNTKGLPANRTIMQYDGNLVIYAAGSKTYGESYIWSSETYENNRGAYLVLEDDGNLIVYSRKKVPVWQSFYY